MKSILMVAAENGALPDGKVGGVGDVIRELPPAIGRLGHRVHVVVPSYGIYQRLPEAAQTVRLKVPFRGTTQDVTVYRLGRPDTAVTQWVIDHPLFGATPGQIYHDDPPGTPFATDATLYALFGLAVSACIDRAVFGPLDAVHLHDWHAAFVLLMRAGNPVLKRIRIAYTIHNLALQGIRPFRGHPSSLYGWFPGRRFDEKDIVDPRYPDCFNPMRAGIRLSDHVHVVSPTYAREVLEPSREEIGLHGGEGLEADLQAAARAGRLSGILNGCEYRTEDTTRIETRALLDIVRETLSDWVRSERQLTPAHLTALSNLNVVTARPDPGFIVTSVGRLTDQKVALLRIELEPGHTVLDAMLDRLKDRGVLIMVGKGDAAFERFFGQRATRYPQFLFLPGYSELVARTIYRGGDLFLMPSLFEPCGISQLLAMRAGQPCLVNATGGLRDTVVDDVTGFVFEGADLPGKAAALLERFDQVLTLHDNEPTRWRGICDNAAAARFEWQDTARTIVRRLYDLDGGTAELTRAGGER